ncbi:MAG TPA: hypothetical protein VIR27_16445, partial [Mycobacteriales bacterium]
ATTRSGGVDAASDWRGRTEEDTTDRRDFVLGTGAAAGLMVGALLDEPDRMNAALDTGAVSEERLTALEGTADRLGELALTVPAAPLLGDTLTAFRTVRGLIGMRQRTADRVRLVRTGAKLALVMGDVLIVEGQLRPASQWYETARSAALDIGDPFLADLALGGSCYAPTYFGDPRDVIRLVSPRIEGRHPKDTPAVSWLWAFKAKAHAALGEKTAFGHSINRSREILDAAPADLNGPGIFAFRPGKLAFYEATGCVRLRETDGAIRAADRALNLYASDNTLGSNQDPALIQLDKASALVQSGEIVEACRVGIGAIVDENTYPSSTVVRRAHEFNELLGPNTTAPARDWRDALHTVTTRRPALATT